MITMTATEVNRNFSRVLDRLERGEDEIVVLRNHHPVARLIPGAPRLSALEALSDLHRTLDDEDGEAWLADLKTADQPLVKELRDPWA
jgi:antitoxin (DNA-binding transcriptional repressor) of toxin-antitoxin stability system